MARASGARRRHNRLSAPAATKNSTEDAVTNAHANPREINPAGRWRILVRGLRASMRASTIRLNAIAADRAPTMATTIQPALAAIPAVWYPPARSSSILLCRLCTSVLFFVAAGALNRLCLRLAPLALAIVFFYSFTKRFTRYSHLVLGFSLGIAPAAAWIAVRGSLDPRILWLTAAVTFWTAGFDVIYACQDYAFDCAEGLLSIPRSLGIAGALRVAQLLHVLMVVSLAALVMSLQLGPLAMAGVAAVVALLVYEHSLVKPDDLSRVNAAFFTLNGWVSVLFFIFWAADIFLHKPGI